MTWSTDGFYRETPDKVAYRIEEGCSVVEMECASLAAVAQLRRAIWGLLLFTADSLADLENYDQRDWGSEAFEEGLRIMPRNGSLLVGLFSFYDTMKLC